MEAPACEWQISQRQNLKGFHFYLKWLLLQQYAENRHLPGVWWTGFTLFTRLVDVYRLCINVSHTWATPGLTLFPLAGRLHKTPHGHNVTTTRIIVGDNSCLIHLTLPNPKFGPCQKVLCLLKCVPRGWRKSKKKIKCVFDQPLSIPPDCTVGTPTVLLNKSPHSSVCLLACLYCFVCAVMVFLIMPRMCHRSLSPSPCEVQ